MILYSYVRAHSCATFTTTIQQALLKIRVAQIEIEFKPNEFGDHRVVRLQGCGLCFRVKGAFTLSIFTDSNHRVAMKFVCGRSESVGLSLFSDARKPLNLSCSWQMSLVFLALRPALTLRQRVSYSRKSPS